MKHKHVLSAILVGTVFVMSGLTSINVLAVTSKHDDAFEDYLNEVYQVCIGAVPIPPEATPELGDLCLELFGASYSGSSAGFVSVNNIGTSGAISRSSNNSAATVKSTVKDRLEDLEDEKESGGASADGNGGWGILVAPQAGKTDRSETINENGFESDLTGLTLGVDYRFSDSFVLGLAFGTIEDDAAFDNNSGTLLTESDSFTVYGTWAPSEDMYFDGYVGFTSMSFESVRFSTFGPNPTQTVFGNMDGDQLLLGFSGGYDWYLSDISIGTFLNLDYVETTIDEYDETGSTTLRLRYFEQESKSFTSSLGVRVSKYTNVSWATLVPNARVMFVHEYQDNSRDVASTLIALPTSDFIVETDSPDRNYILFGVGVTAAMGGNKQLYLDYEQQAAHEFLDTWTVSAGFLMEF